MEKIEVKNPDQYYVNNWIIYDALGGPAIDENKWSLKIAGLVDKPAEYSYKELNEMPGIEYISDFNCVTKWSIKDAKFTGPSLRDIIMKSGPSPKAEWVMFICADGYDTPIPFDDAVDKNSMLALRIDDKPLGIKHGFPARPFMPSLYGWKSAKWVTEIKIMEKYEDGYWEAYGYHERGNVEGQERFKGFGRKKIRRNSEIEK
jgi:DMSO/TMAO reductase YedYZ molybdopterin-dependent catalytic subunit